MIEERTVTVDGRAYTVTISDEHKALLDAYAAGGAVVGLWREGMGDSLEPAEYVVEDMEDADDEFLGRVVRRRLGLPWVIAETERLWIREFSMEDLPFLAKEEDDTLEDASFLEKDKLKAYIENQYGFFEYGIWALVEKETGCLIGKAGICNLDLEDMVNEERSGDREEAELELGYHIFAPFRRKGYARESCEAILAYASSHITGHLYARINPENEPSVNLAESLGFRFISERYSEVIRYMCLYEWYCS